MAASDPIDEFWRDGVGDAEAIPAPGLDSVDPNDEFWQDSELLDEDIAAAAPPGLDSDTVAIVRAGFTKIDVTGVFVGRDGKDREETMRKGKELAQHIIHVEERQVGGTATISAKCIRQQSISTKAPFNLEMKVDLVSRKWLSGRCGPDCPTGAEGKCKHSYALVQYINSERTEACTDAQAKWPKPSDTVEALYPKGKTIEELYTGR